MEEKRKERRLPVSMKLEISSLFRQDNERLENMDAPIRVLDISKSGIGFISADQLPVGFYFNAGINLGSEEAKLYCVVKIIRKIEIGDGEYNYGCELVGIAPVLSYIFDDYEKKYDEGKMD